MRGGSGWLTNDTIHFHPLHMSIDQEHVVLAATFLVIIATGIFFAKFLTYVLAILIEFSIYIGIAYVCYRVYVEKDDIHLLMSESTILLTRLIDAFKIVITRRYT